MAAVLGSCRVLYLQTQAFSKQGRYRFGDEKFAAQTEKGTCSRSCGKLVAGLGREACWSDSLLLWHPCHYFTSIIILTYLLYSFTSDLLPPSYYSWSEDFNFCWPYNGGENVAISPPLLFFFPPSVSLLITQKCWLFISGCRLRKPQSDRQEQWMIWRKSLCCTALQRSLSSSMTVLPCLSHTSKQHHADTLPFSCSLKCKRAWIYSALCSSWHCCLWRRTWSAPQCPPSGLLLSHVPSRAWPQSCLSLLCCCLGSSRVGFIPTPPLCGVCDSQRSLSACDNCCKSFYK